MHFAGQFGDIASGSTAGTWRDLGTRYCGLATGEGGRQGMVWLRVRAGDGARCHYVNGKRRRYGYGHRDERSVCEEREREGERGG